MDISIKTGDSAQRAKAEKYAKIISKTIICGDGSSADYGQNAFFYDSAEGLLTSVILLLSEYLQPKENETDSRHIVSVFKIVQELTAKDKNDGGKTEFEILLQKLPQEHKARWFAGAALNAAEQAMSTVLSTVMSRLNSFLDSEMEQILCFNTDVKYFCNNF